MTVQVQGMSRNSSWFCVCSSSSMGRSASLIVVLSLGTTKQSLTAHPLESSFIKAKPLLICWMLQALNHHCGQLKMKLFLVGKKHILSNNTYIISSINVEHV